MKSFKLSITGSFVVYRKLCGDGYGDMERLGDTLGMHITSREPIKKEQYISYE